jgi:hypothetical protein
MFINNPGKYAAIVRVQKWSRRRVKRSGALVMAATSAAVLGAVPFLSATASPGAMTPGTSALPGAAPAPGGTATPERTATPDDTEMSGDESEEAPEEEATPEETADPEVTAHKIRSVNRVCRRMSYFTIGFHRHHDLFVPRTHFVDGPAPAGGAEMKVIVTRSHVFNLDMELEIERERELAIKDLVIKARKMVNPEISESHTVDVGHEYVVHTTKGRYGHLRYRVFGYRVGFQHWKVFSDCGRLKVVSGVADFPTAREGWKYWETRHA